MLNSNALHDIIWKGSTPGLVWHHFKLPLYEIYITLLSAEHIAADMPRKSTKKAKKRVDSMHRYCLYCGAHRDGRGFDKHQAACKLIWQLHRKRRDKNSVDKPIQAEKDNGPEISHLAEPAEVAEFLNAYTL